MKKIILTTAILASLFTACSSDDAVTEEPIVENPVENPVEQCDCITTRYKVVLGTPGGVPVDTLKIRNGYVTNYQRDCGYDEWEVDGNTVNMWGWETENIKCGQ